MQKHLMLLALLPLALFADTTNKTWADGEWSTDWTGVLDAGTCETVGCSYSATGGNPTHLFFCTCVGRNDTATMHVEWAGTWETLGVTAGHTITSWQMTGVDTRQTAYNVCTTSTIGPFELRDSGGTLVTTGWAGRTPTAAEGGWTSTGAQTAQGCGSVCASGASIQLWFNGDLDTGNDKVAECTFGIDNLSIQIIHEAAAAVGFGILITRVRFGVEGNALRVLSSVTEPLAGLRGQAGGAHLHPWRMRGPRGRLGNGRQAGGLGTGRRRAPADRPSSPAGAAATHLQASGANEDFLSGRPEQNRACVPKSEQRPALTVAGGGSIPEGGR